MSLCSLPLGWKFPVGSLLISLPIGFVILELLRRVGVLPVRYFRVGVLALIVGCVAGVVVLRGTTPPAPPLTIRVALLPLRSSVPSTQPDGLGMGIGEAALDLLRLSATPRFRLAASDEVEEAVEDGEVFDLASALEVSGKLGARFVVFGAYDTTGGGLTLQAHLLDASRRAMITRRIQCAPESLSTAPLRLAQAISEVFHLPTAPLSSSEPAIPLPPSAAFAQYCLGRASFHAGTPDGYWQAIEAYRTALQIDSTYAFPYWGLAQVYHTWQREGAGYRTENEAMRRKAIQYARKALTLNPRLNEAYRLIAKTYKALNDWESMNVVLKQAILAEPDEPRNYIALTQLLPERYQDLGFKDEAALCERAVTLNPESSLLRVRLVRAYIAVGKLKDAVDAGQQVVEMAPTVADAYECLGEAYNFTNRSTKAVAAFTKAIALNPKRQGPYIGLATAYALKVDHPHVIAAYQQGIAALPRNADLYYNLGVLYQRIAKPELAVQAFEKAVEVGNHLNAHFYLGYLYEKQGQQEKAIQHWRQRVERGDPSDPWTKDAMKRLNALSPEASKAIGVGR